MKNGHGEKWRLLPFCDAIQDKTGGNPKIQQSDYLEDGLFPVIDQGKKVGKGFTSDKSLLCKETVPVILFGDHTTEFKYVDFPFALGADGVKVLKPIDALNGKFAYHFLKQAKFHKEDGYSRHFKFLKRLTVPIPPLREQERIVEILDKADAIRCKREKAIELIDSLLRSVFIEFFGDPNTNSKKWARGTIRDLVSEVKYGTSGKASASGRYEILRMNNITYNGQIDLTSLKYIDIDPDDEDKYLTQNGDILFNRTNSKELVGKSAVYCFDKPRAIAGYLIRVRPNSKANSEYIAAYLNSKHGKNTLQHMCKSIIGMANINAQELQEIKIQIPPIELQDRFAQIVKKIRVSMVEHTNARSKADLLFKALSSNFFSRGQLSKNSSKTTEEAHALQL
jgi:type I restriction enzyme, S subunit